MALNKQKEDEILLAQQPEQLVWKYKKVVEQLVNRFWKEKAISESEEEMITTMVFQRLPTRLAKFQKKAEGETYVLTLLVECTQTICNDLLDLQLLDQKSPQLVLKYLPYISARLDYLVQTDFFKAQDSGDVLQWTQQKLLEKLQSGQLSKFESTNETLFRTFLYRVVKNLFTDLYRSLYRTQKNSQQLELKAPLIAHKSDASSNPFEQLSDEMNLSQQIRRMNQILCLYSFNSRLKFELCLKTNYFLLLYPADIQALQLTTKEVNQLLDFFGNDYQQESSGKIWQKLNQYINRWEGKQANADTLRKWFTRQRNQLMAKLLVLTLIDRELTQSLQKKATYNMLLQKINKDRAVAKYAYQWFGDIVYAYYQIR